jgi:hypothetical protein
VIGVADNAHKEGIHILDSFDGIELLSVPLDKMSFDVSPRVFERGASGVTWLYSHCIYPEYSAANPLLESKDFDRGCK